MSNTYNGWTNYATWRVNLEVFDGLSPADITGERNPSIYDLSQALKSQAEELVEGNDLATDYALAFLSDVNWAEIARSMIDLYLEEVEA